MRSRASSFKFQYLLFYRALNYLLWFLGNWVGSATLFIGFISQKTLIISRHLSAWGKQIKKFGYSPIPEVGFETTFPVLQVAQQRIPEVKQICATLILLVVSFNFFIEYNIKKCIILRNLIFRNQGNSYLNDKNPEVNFLEYA